MKYKVSHTTKFAYSDVVPVCHNVVHLAPRSLPHQTCNNFRLLIHPEPMAFSHRDDYFGNQVSHFAIDQAHRGMAVTASSVVEVVDREPMDPGTTPSWEEISASLRSNRMAETLSACEFVQFSPRIEPFAELAEYASESFLPGRPILAAVVDLTDRIHQGFNYDPEATTIHTPIQEVFRNRQGVCQDFAHLEIGCLRKLGLAARYVSGYLRTVPPAGKPRLVGADASHAWLSVYCGDAGWIDVDPTNNVLVTNDHITVAWGRDYDDVCPIQGVIVGGGEHSMEVGVDVEPQET